MDLNRNDIAMLSLLTVVLVAGYFGASEVPSPAAQAEELAAAAAPVETPATVTVAEVSVTPASETTAPRNLPDFAAYANVQAKKQAFFDFMLPKVRASNEKILNLRDELINIDHRLNANGMLADDDLETLAHLVRRYRVRNVADESAAIDALLLKIDVVPESLVLAQAANESGWGTSRFARKANNMFGVWCFSKGCGLTPLSRTEGLSHEVAAYDSVQASVDAYIHTINSNPAYIMLREIRAENRAEAEYLSGVALAEGLEKYSERGEDYVREIQAMIRHNNLQQYTQPLAGQAV